MVLKYAWKTDKSDGFVRFCNLKKIKLKDSHEQSATTYKVVVFLGLTMNPWTCIDDKLPLCADIRHKS